MPATPLSSKYEQAPSGALPKFYVPFMGLPHKVSDGENWGNVAAYYGYSDPLELIQYNFSTKDPKAINYYLNREFPSDLKPEALHKLVETLDKQGDKTESEKYRQQLQSEFPEWKPQ